LRRLCALLVIAAVSFVCGFCPEVSLGADPYLDAEANQWAENIQKQDFFVPYNRATTRATQIELFVEQSCRAQEIALWFATEQGRIAIQLRDPTGLPLLAWQGTRGEQRLTEMLASGKYVLSIEPIDKTNEKAEVRGVIGIKGWATGGCEVDSNRVIEQQADPPRYWWPYLLVKARSLVANAPATTRPGALLVLPNNPGFPSEDLALLRADANCELGSALETADALDAAVLIPLFPRPWRFNLQALTRESLKEDLVPRFNRIDRQLIAMIDDAAAKLAAMDRPVWPRVLMAGFSASGAFANRFAMLHPDRVLAAAAGSPGGWPIAPVSDDQGEKLRYPVGIADVAKLARETINPDVLRSVRFFIFLGKNDTNDSVPFADSFAPADAELINRRFGATLQERWEPAQRLYQAAGLNAQFKEYPDAAHEFTTAMWNDDTDLFRKALAAP